MNNLKRVLSLALSGIMLVGMMAVGASAADFSDADKISNTDAVNTLVSLGVINGKDDGSYAPEEIVTRSQMAKMICVALNGGKDFTYGTKTTPTYSDIKGHWAESYIEYCTSLNIIAGQGDGTFNPDAPVTASAASKMLLVAIGYDAEDEGMVGVDWEVNTNRLADNKGFYKSLSGLNVSEGLSRDDAAQVIYNACKATMVEYDYKLVTDNGNLATKPVAKDRQKGGVDVTILTEKFDMQPEAEGVLYGAEYVEATSKAAAKFGYSLDDDFDGSGVAVTFENTETDYTALLGEKVKVLYKLDGTKKIIYGVYSVSDKVVEGTVGDLSDITDGKDTVKLDGTKYTLAGNVETIPCYNFVETSGDFGSEAYKLNAITDSPASAIKLVSNNANGKIDYAVVTPVTVAKVTFTNKDGITAGNSYKYEDHNIVEGLTKGDFVAIVAAANTVDGKANVTKVDVINGTVEAVKSSEAKVDGKWYKTNGHTVALGESYDLAVVGNYIYNADKTSEGSSMDDLCYVPVKGESPKFGTSETKIYFADGSSKIVKVEDIKKSADDAANEATPVGLYTYKVNKSGNYDLTKVDSTTDNLLDADGVNTNVGTWDADAKKVGSYYIADDAVVFVVTNDTKKIDVITGKDAQKLAGWGGTSNTALYKTVNGMLTAQAVVLVGASGENTLPVNDGSTKYGFVLTTPEQIKEGDDKYWSFKLWTEDGEMDVLCEDATMAADTGKGRPISYTDLGGGKIKTAAKLTDATDAVAITGMNGDDLALYLTDGTAHSVTKKDKDTVILYVNTKDDAGVEGGELDLAQDAAGGGKIINAWVVDSNSNNTADVIIYDVNGDIDNLDNDGAGVAGLAVTATITPETEGYTATADKAKALPGDKVTVTVTATAAAAAKGLTAAASTGATMGSVTTGTKEADTAATFVFEMTVGTGAPTMTITLA